MKVVRTILLAAIAYIIASVLSEVISSALHLPEPAIPAGATATQLFRNLIFASPLLMAALMPLASGLIGKWGKRWLVMAFLLFITVGLNTAIEASVFTVSLGKNAAVTLTLGTVLPALASAAVLVSGTAQRSDTPAVWVRFGPAAWGWRLLVAWLAFPVIYFVFGMSIAPIVMPYYKAGVAGVTIPPVDVVIRTQLVRSALFLLCSLPPLMLWRKSRGSVFLAMGLAHAVAVGIFGLVQASFFPMTLRVVHSIEITADSFAYAGVLVLLFVRITAAAKPVSAAAVTGD